MRKSESFLRRWSRLKIQARQASSSFPAPVAVPLPDALDADADFSAYLHSDVDRVARQDALRRLFMTDRYRTIDGLDVYVEDCSNPELLPAGMLEKLDHARQMLGMENPQDVPAAEVGAAGKESAA